MTFKSVSSSSSFSFRRADSIQPSRRPLQLKGNKYSPSQNPLIPKETLQAVVEGQSQRSTHPPPQSETPNPHPGHWHAEQTLTAESCSSLDSAYLIAGPQINFHLSSESHAARMSSPPPHPCWFSFLHRQSPFFLFFSFLSLPPSPPPPLLSGLQAVKAHASTRVGGERSRSMNGVMGVGRVISGCEQASGASSGSA